MYNISFPDPFDEHQYQKPFFEQTITLLNNESRLLITYVYEHKLNLLNRKKYDIEKVVFSCWLFAS